MEKENVKQLVEVEAKAISELIESSPLVPIVNQDSYDIALDITKKIKRTMKDLKAKRMSITRPIDESKKIVMDLFRDPIERLEKYESSLKQMILKYTQEQERIRLEEQRKADELARKERERIEEQARKQREKEAAELAKAEEAERKAREAKNEAERIRLENEAAKAKAKADKAAAAAEIKTQIAETVVSQEVEQKVEKHGFYTVKTYSVFVTDKLAFVKWCIEKNLLGYLEINKMPLNTEAKAAKGQISWPGIGVNEMIQSRTKQ